MLSAQFSPFLARRSPPSGRPAALIRLFSSIIRASFAVVCPAPAAVWLACHAYLAAFQRYPHICRRCPPSARCRRVGLPRLSGRFPTLSGP
eukprot:2778097-Alexandrium_andersonii.AAC.1